MSDGPSAQERFERVIRAGEERKAHRALDFQSGGGDSGGMDARVARIEDDVKELKLDMKGATARLASVEGKLDLLTTQIIGKIPTGWTFFGVIFGTLIAVPTVLGALFWVARYLEIIPKP